MEFVSLKNRLNGIGFDTVTTIKQALLDANKKASGGLVEKTRFILEAQPSFISLRMLAPAHWKYVDEGRKPGKRPPFTKIKQWVRRKRLNLSGISADQLAFLVARKIGEEGIDPTGIYSDAIKNLRTTVNIGQMARPDVQKSIRQVLKQ